MSKYQYTDKCDEISGFDGAYEEQCRKMVSAGVEWFDKNKGANPKFKGYKNIFGLIIEDNKEAKKLTKTMNNAIEGAATGAMMQCCLEHVRYAYQYGWDKYIEVMENQNETT